MNRRRLWLTFGIGLVLIISISFWVQRGYTRYERAYARLFYDYRCRLRRLTQHFVEVYSQESGILRSFSVVQEWAGLQSFGGELRWQLLFNGAKDGKPQCTILAVFEVKKELLD